MGNINTQPVKESQPLWSQPKELPEDLYTFVYDYSTLNEQEKEKVVNLIKSKIAEYYAENKVFGTYSMSIPKFLLLNRDKDTGVHTYFNIATAAFQNVMCCEDRWLWQYNNRKPINRTIINNDELFDIIVTEITKYNKTPFTIDSSYEYGLIGDVYRYCQKYTDENDKNNKVYGHIPIGYRDYTTRYPVISIKVQNIYNLKNLNDVAGLETAKTSENVLLPLQRNIGGACAPYAEPNNPSNF